MTNEQEIIDGADLSVDVISFPSESGGEDFFAITMTVEHEGNKFVLLSQVMLVDDLAVPVETPDIFVAKLVIDENGAEMYLDPTDEEFEAVAKIAGEFQEEN